MKPLVKSMLISIVMIFSMAVWAVPAIGAEEDQLQSKPSQEELHDGLRELKKTMEDAINNRDIDTILKHVDDRVVFTTMNGDVARGKEQIRDYFSEMMTGPDRIVEKVTTRFEADDLSIIHDDNIAIAFGHTDDHYTLADGSTYNIKARWSGTMMLRNNEWVILSFHYSTNVFDNAILKAQRKLLITISVFIILIASIIFFFFGRKVGRRKA